MIVGDRKVISSKAATGALVWLIAFILLFSQVPAFADDDEAPVEVDAVLMGYVSDLGTQNIRIRGNGGVANFVSGTSDVETRRLTFDAEARVIDGSVTGGGQLNFEGKTSAGDKVAVKVNYKISSGAGLDLPCDVLPPPCDDSDLIPFFYFGDGKASIRVGSSESKVNVVVVIDALGHPPLAGGFISVVALDSGTPLLDFTIDVASYKVDYKGTVVLADVSGDLTGGAKLIVQSSEDHTALPEETSSVDKGKIEFAVVHQGEQIDMKGSFEGKSTGWPMYSFSPTCDPLVPSVASSGKFRTEDDASLKGTYNTNWCTPFTFTSQFSGKLKLDD